MANLTQHEFARAIELLAEDLGLQRLRDRFVRLNALVTRRRAVSPQRLADQLYLLTGGLRRQIAATVAVHSIWTERVNAKLGEEREKELEQLAEKINACLDERESIVAGKEEELSDLLGQYERQLAQVMGPEWARLDMLLKAVPAVAEKLRAEALVTPVQSAAATSQPD